MAATGLPLAAGAVFQVTVPSAQLELAAPRKTPPMLELSLVLLPTVRRSLAAVMLGQLVPAPVPLTVNFSSRSLTGLGSTVIGLLMPALTVVLAASMVA